MFDVVTTSIYTYTQYAGGPELEDRTLALKLLRIVQAMHSTMESAKGDAREPKALREQMAQA